MCMTAAFGHTPSLAFGNICSARFPLPPCAAVPRSGNCLQALVTVDTQHKMARPTCLSSQSPKMTWVQSVHHSLFQLQAHTQTAMSSNQHCAPGIHGWGLTFADRSRRCRVTWRRKADKFVTPGRSRESLRGISANLFKIYQRVTG